MKNLHKLTVAKNKFLVDIMFCEKMLLYRERELNLLENQLRQLVFDRNDFLSELNRSDSTATQEFTKMLERNDIYGKAENIKRLTELVNKNKALIKIDIEHVKNLKINLNDINNEIFIEELKNNNRLIVKVIELLRPRRNK